MKALRAALKQFRTNIKPFIPTKLFPTLSARFEAGR
jgi:hypothetical protein